jgi:hypothetical protein
VKFGIVRNPAGVSLTFVVCTGLVATLLRWVTQQGGTTRQALVDSTPFQAWVAFAAIAVVAFADMFIAGVRELHRDELRKVSPSLAFFSCYFVVFAGVVLGILRFGGHGGPDIPIDHWNAITLALLFVGVLGAAPWVVAVWSTHSTLHQAREHVNALQPVAAQQTHVDLDLELRKLLMYRAVIVKAVSRLLTIVLAAVLLSGALRAAVVPRYVSEKDFPTSAILIYGAFFTVALSAAVVPLLVRWRENAKQLVDAAYPPAVNDANGEARSSMVQALNINGSLFTFPVTLGALLAPLITSLLSVYIPQLGT